MARLDECTWLVVLQNSFDSDLQVDGEIMWNLVDTQNMFKV